MVLLFVQLPVPDVHKEIRSMSYHNRETYAGLELRRQHGASPGQLKVKHTLLLWINQRR